MLNRYGDEAVKAPNEPRNSRRMAILGAWRFGCASSTQSGSLRSQRRSGPYTRGTAAPAVGLEFPPDAVGSSVEFLEGQIRGEEPAIIGFGEPERLP
jgi:hypothetical protein